MGIIDWLRRWFERSSRNAEFQKHLERINRRVTNTKPGEAETRRALADLRSPDRATREAATKLLMAGPMPAADIIALLLDGLVPVIPRPEWPMVSDPRIPGSRQPSGPSTEHGRAGVAILLTLGAEGRHALLALTRCWNRTVAEAASQALADTEEGRTTLVNGLVSAPDTRHGDRFPQRFQLCWQRLTELGVAALPHLVAGLHHRDHQIRRSVAELLGQLGPAGAPAIPALAEIVAAGAPPAIEVTSFSQGPFRQEETRKAAIAALQRIGTPEARQILNRQGG